MVVQVEQVVVVQLVLAVLVELVVLVVLHLPCLIMFNVCANISYLYSIFKFSCSTYLSFTLQYISKYLC